jgi:ATP-dependent Clp protease protease subunit
MRDWLQERLFERRIVIISGPLDDAVASRAAAQLIMLDGSGGVPIEIHLDSPDGTLEAAFALIDTLDALGTEVRIRCRGQVGGPAIGVVASAPHRTAAPHTRFRLAQPTAQFSGTAEELRSRSQQQRDLLWRLQARVARATGRPVEAIADDMRRGLYLDAQAALDYGLIDAVTGTAS